MKIFKTTRSTSIAVTAVTTAALVLVTADPGRSHGANATDFVDLDSGIRLTASANFNSPHVDAIIPANTNVSYESTSGSHFIHLKNRSEEPETSVVYEWSLTLRHDSEESPRAQLGAGGVLAILDPNQEVTHGDLSTDFAATAGSHTTLAEASVSDDNSVGVIVSHGHSWVQH